MENATERMTVNNAKLERDPVKTVILASMMGTAIEFFDFLCIRDGFGSLFSEGILSTDDAIISYAAESLDVWGCLCRASGWLICFWPFW